MIKKIKIYGERNTGTNYLEKLIKKNFNVTLLKGVAPSNICRLSDFYQMVFPSFSKKFPFDERIKDNFFKLSSSKNLGWKHTLISPSLNITISKFSDNVLFITITKNPYSWLLSLYNNPYHTQIIHSDFEQFLKNPWKPVQRENFSNQFSNPIDIWNQKNKSYIKLKDNFTTLNIKYEDLLADPEKIIENISDHLKLTRKNKTFKNIEKSTKEKNKNFDFYKNYYLNEKWKDELSSKSIDFINKNIDYNLMRYFNYKKIQN